MWCVTCAKKRAKALKKPYLKSRAITSWKDEWVKFAKEITEEQQKELAAEEENSSNTRLEPNNAETGKAWRYIENAIVPIKDKEDENVNMAVNEVSIDAISFKKGKVLIEVVDCTVQGDLKQDKSYDFSISITYKASTSLPSGALVEGKGQSIVQMKDGETTCVVKEYGACVLNPGDESTLTPEMTEQMLGKCEVLAKFYKKKCMPLVLQRLDTAREKISSLLE
jgi:hypothetical protein